MELSLHNIVEMIAVISFAGGVLNYVIVKPLRDAVNTLSKALDKLEQTLTDVKEKEITLEQRVTHTEDSVKVAHKRIDKLEQYHQKPINRK